jgi:hypothetical protein
MAVSSTNQDHMNVVLSAPFREAAQDQPDRGEIGSYRPREAARRTGLQTDVVEARAPERAKPLALTECGTSLQPAGRSPFESTKRSVEFIVQ